MANNLTPNPANDKTVWKKYFDKIACYYVKLFFENLSEIRSCFNEIYEVRHNQEQANYNRRILKEIKNYYQAYQCLLPQADGSIMVDEEMMNNFKEVKTRAYSKEIVGKRLKKMEIEGYELSLNELRNIMIAFYKEEEFRQAFFRGLQKDSGEDTSPPNVQYEKSMTREIPLHLVQNQSRLRRYVS